MCSSMVGVKSSLFASMGDVVQQQGANSSSTALGQDKCSNENSAGRRSIDDFHKKCRRSSLRPLVLVQRLREKFSRE